MPELLLEQCATDLPVNFDPFAGTPENPYVTKTPDVDFVPAAPERHPLRDRLFRSRPGRTALAVVAGLGGRAL